MPDSQNTFESAGSYRMLEPRFLITAEPSPVPIGSHLSPSLAFDSRPCCAMLTIITSPSGLADRYEALPHSDSSSTRLKVSFSHSPIGASPPTLTSPPTL